MLTKRDKFVFKFLIALILLIWAYYAWAYLTSLIIDLVNELIYPHREAADAIMLEFSGTYIESIIISRFYF